MSVVEAAEIVPGMRVLDLCAAPGGKSGGIAARLCGRGILVSNEIIPNRAKLLARNLERLGIVNAVVTSAHPDAVAEALPQYFDRVVVDAPCSGEGMFRKEEAAVTDWSEATPWPCAPRGSRRSSPPQPKCWPPAGGRLFHLHVLARGKRGRHLRLPACASGVFRRAGRGSLVLSGAAGLDRRSRARSGACLPPLAALPAR